MVFIVLGAIKAAKHARLEYKKNEKRNSVITSVDGSHDMMADRASSSQPHPNPNSSTDWWGTNRTADGPVPRPDAPDNHAGAGAWSRDHTIQQVADAQSPPLPLPQSPSAQHPSPSPSSILDSTVRRSRSSDDVPIPVPQPPRASVEHGGAGQQHYVSQKDNSNSVIESSSESQAREGIPPKQSSHAERTSGEASQRTSVVEGSFEAALRSKPTEKKESKQDTKLAHPDQSISALSRDASKGYRKRSSRTGDSLIAPADNSPNREESAMPVVISALARNASKGARRGSRPSNFPSSSAAIRTSLGSIDEVRGSHGDPQTGGSVFSGTVTKKRIGRRDVMKAQSSESISTTEPNVATAESLQGPPSAARTVTAVTGSSMYAQGSMKKRSSRR